MYNIPKIDRFFIKIAIVDSKIVVGIRINVNRQSNSDRDFDTTTTIQFGTSNRISLLFADGQILNYTTLPTILESRYITQHESTSIGDADQCRA